MKKLLLVLMVLVSLTSYSQSFTYKKSLFSGTGLPATFLKTKGSLIITDSTITITQDGIETKIVISPVLDNNGVKQYRSTVNTDIDVRYTLTPNLESSKDNEFIFIMESKDKFTNTNSRVMYYLTKNQ